MSRITFNPNVLGGKPIIKGTRISVEFILELLSSGMTQDQIAKEYWHLKKEDVLAALEFAANAIKREEIISPSYLTKKNILV